MCLQFQPHTPSSKKQDIDGEDLNKMKVDLVSRYVQTAKMSYFKVLHRKRADEQTEKQIMNRWINDRVNERVNFWMNAQTNKGINECVEEIIKFRNEGLNK